MRKQSPLCFAAGFTPSNEMEACIIVCAVILLKAPTSGVKSWVLGISLWQRTMSRGTPRIALWPHFSFWSMQSKLLAWAKTASAKIAKNDLLIIATLSRIQRGRQQRQRDSHKRKRRETDASNF